MILSRKIKDKFSTGWMMVCLSVCLVMPLAIATGLVIKSLPLLHTHSLKSLIASSDWSPSDGQFGFWPFILSSVWVTVIAVLICVPLCLLAAIFLSQFAPKWMLGFMRPVMDILAGIPSVVYGVWGLLVIVPLTADKNRPFFQCRYFRL